MIEYKTIQIPFVAGLAGDQDPRAKVPPSLEKAQNVRFSLKGGIQKTYPYTALATDTEAGGTISNIRRIVPYGDELVAFTDTEIYSWAPNEAVWVTRGTYYAPEIREKTMFAANYEQYDTDRAQLGGVVFHTWSAEEASASAAVWCAATDATTGAVIYPPTEMGTWTRPRLVALTNKVLFFYVSGSSLYVRNFDPTAVTTSIETASTTVQSGTMGGEYDVAQLDGTTAIVASQNSTGPNYRVHTVSEAKSVSTTAKARRADSAICVTANADGSYIFVGRYNGSSADYEADILVGSDQSDTAYVNKVIYTPVTTPNPQATCAVSSTQVGGEDVCHYFVSEPEEQDETLWYTIRNTLDTAGSLGTNRGVVYRCGLASRAFDYNGEIFVWTVFSNSSTVSAMSTDALEANLQDSYFLVRVDDAEGATGNPRGDSVVGGFGAVEAKAAAGIAAGFRTTGSHLPTVQNTSGNIYTCCMGERRLITLGSNQTGFAARTPRDVTVEFDSNEARRLVKLGKTGYITGGQILQYDGMPWPVEVGFHVYPWYFKATDNAAGDLAAGDYTWKATLAYENAQGELDRSTTGTLTQITMGASREAQIVLLGASPTLKQGARAFSSFEIWRTTVDPTSSTPYYLATSKDPTTSGDNAHILNKLTVTWNDSYVDTVLDDKETDPELGGAILPNIAPPAAGIIAASNDRLFLAACGGEPDTVRYTKWRGEGEVAAFSDLLKFIVPAKGGAITGLAHLHETLVIFRERAIFATAGEGFDNTGGGQNYSVRMVANDVGAQNADLVCETPHGIVFFSDKGWHLLDRGWTVQYIGGPVANFDSDSWQCVHVVEKAHQIRCLSTSRVIVYDYDAKQWSEDALVVGEHACVWRGDYCYVNDAGSSVKVDDNAAGGGHSMVIESAWINFGNWSDLKRIKYILVTGEYRSACALKMELFKNGDATTAFQTKTFTKSSGTAGDQFEFRHKPSQTKLRALKIKLTTRAVGGASAEAGEGLRLTSLALRVGFKPGFAPDLTASKKQ